MLHGLKVSMAKGTSKKNIVREDDSLNATYNTLLQYRVSLESVQSSIVANESAWNALFVSYSTLETTATSIYAAHDADALAFLKELSASRARLQSQPTGAEPYANAAQRLEISKKEIADLVTRINEALQLHTKRLDDIRQFKYYDSKTRQILATGTKRQGNQSAKEVDRRDRNQKKVQELSVKVTSTTGTLNNEVEQIEVERLNVTDRACSALVLFQKQIFDSNPVADAARAAEKLRLGTRVVPRDETRPWKSDRSYQPPAFAPPPPMQPAGNTMDYSPNPEYAQGVGGFTPTAFPAQPSVPPGAHPPAPPPPMQAQVPPPVPGQPPYVPPPADAQQYSNGMPQNFSAQSYGSSPTAPMAENESFRQEQRSSAPIPTPPPPPPPPVRPTSQPNP